ncbi:MAG: type II toxin-antitoxin system YafQ family toxin [Deferribacterales bacterium]
MPYRILYTDSYNKKAARFLKKHPEIVPLYKKALLLLEINPFHNSLRLHKLSGKYSDLYSISINLQYRVTIELIISDEKIIPINIGDHSTVYK